MVFLRVFFINLAGLAARFAFNKIIIKYLLTLYSIILSILIFLGRVIALSKLFCINTLLIVWLTI